MRARQLAEDEKNPSSNMGPNGLPLFTSTASVAKLTRNEACSYFNFSQEDLKWVLPEGLPIGMVKEFEDSMRKALLVRQGFLDLRDNFRRIVDPSLFPTTPKACVDQEEAYRQDLATKSTHKVEKDEGYN